MNWECIALFRRDYALFCWIIISSSFMLIYKNLNSRLKKLNRCVNIIIIGNDIKFAQIDEVTYLTVSL